MPLPLQVVEKYGIATQELPYRLFDIGQLQEGIKDVDVTLGDMQVLFEPGLGHCHNRRRAHAAEIDRDPVGLLVVDGSPHTLAVVQSDIYLPA